MKEVAVPQGVYRHLQGGFAINNARMSVKSGTNLVDRRIFHPGDAFVNVIKWLWGGIQGGEVSGDVPGALSGEALAFQLLVDHFCAVNDFLAERDPAPQPMSIEEMITGLSVAGLQEFLGPREWERICVVIRDDVPELVGLQ